jgi:competence protein ComEC
MPLWDRTLDLMVVTQPNNSYIDALAEIPRRLHIVHAIDSHASEIESDLWRTSLQQTDTPVTAMQPGGWLDLGDGVALWILSPSYDTNLSNNQNHEQSFMLKFVYGDFSMLVTGDNALLNAHNLINAGIPIQASLLQLGTNTSNDEVREEFIVAVNPQVTVIQNRECPCYNTSAEKVLSDLAGSNVLQTALAGRIHIYTNSQEMWLETDVNYWLYDSKPKESLLLH